MLTPKQEENVQFVSSSVTSQQNPRDRQVPESSSYAFTSANKPVSNTSSAVRVPSPMNGVKEEANSALDDFRVADVVLTKKVKRKPELELEGTHSGPEKLASLQGEERPRSQKQSAPAGHPTKSNPQPTSLVGLEQSS